MAEIVENVEEASAGNAAREHHTAVGEFFYFGFVAGRCGRSVDIAQGVPRAAEVVAVDHAIAAGACAEGRVKSVVTTHFHELTLANASAAEEHRVDRPEITFVEKRVNLLGDVDRLAPSVSAVATVEHRHAVGVAALGRAVSVNGIARDANHHRLVAAAVAYDGGIAISAGFAAVHAVAFGQNEFAAPSGAVIVREAVAKIHFAETDVATTGAIVAHGDERAAAIHRNGGNAVGRFPGKCLEEGAFHRIVGGGAQQ